jgi:site-specific recombinase XerD
MKLIDLMPLYRRHLLACGHRERGIDRYMQHLRGFLAALPDNATPMHLTTAAVREHMRDRAETCSTATVVGMLTSVRSFCRFLIEEELLPSDPTAAIRWPRRRHLPPRVLNTEELEQLAAALQETSDMTDRQRWHWRRNRRAIYLMYYAGLRLAEAAALVWGDVDLKAGRLIVREGKGGKARALPIHQRLHSVLRPASIGAPAHWAVAGKVDGTPLNPKALAHIFEVWLPSRGVHGITAHRLRHTFATQMLDQGVPLCDIQEALGHTDIGTTRIYLQVDFSRIQGAVDKVPKLL